MGVYGDVQTSTYVRIVGPDGKVYAVSDPSSARSGNPQPFKLGLPGPNLLPGTSFLLLCVLAAAAGATMAYIKKAR